MKFIRAQNPFSHQDSDLSHRKRRITRVGPWRNGAEFTQVKNWIFSKESSTSEKILGLRRLLIWKARRKHLISASILATLEILRIQIRDELHGNDTKNLQFMYANSLMRFLNYMSSIIQDNNVKTMYETARCLGIQGFLVDLRHLCTHSQVLPELKILRRSARYSMNWIKHFFWNEEIEIVGVDSRHIKQKETSDFDNHIQQLFLAYDATVEALCKGNRYVSEAKKSLYPDMFAMLKKMSSTSTKYNELNDLKSGLVRKITALLKLNHQLQDFSSICVNAFVSMDFFFSSVAASSTDGEQKIKYHKQLFQAISSIGLIDDLFLALLYLGDNELESLAKRKGAIFWANQIVMGFIVLQKFKLEYKNEKNRNPDFELNLKTLNTLAIEKGAKSIFQKLNVDWETTLIFGETVHQPWSLSFSSTFMKEKLININCYTSEVMKNCLMLFNPTLPSETLINMSHLIDIYTERKNVFNETKLTGKIYTLDDVFENEMDNFQNPNNKFGPWTVIKEDTADFKVLPLGQLTWQNN